METLIPIETDKEGNKVVSGRAVYEFLSPLTLYKDWIVRKLDYNFEEDVDYTLVAQKKATKNPRNPMTTIVDHVMTLDMAKEICMLEKNAKGRKAREYFIKVEKAYRDLVPSQEKVWKELTSPASMLKIVQKQIELENKIVELQPKADFVDYVLTSENAVPITVIAKGYGMSGTAFNKLLKQLKVQYKVSNTWVVYSEFDNLGYTVSTTQPYQDPISGSVSQIPHTQWTAKGREFLYHLLKKQDILPIQELCSTKDNN